MDGNYFQRCYDPGNANKQKSIKEKGKGTQIAGIEDFWTTRQNLQIGWIKNCKT